MTRPYRLLAIAAALASATTAACSVAPAGAGAAEEVPTGTSSEALLGAFGSADCPADVAGFVPAADNLGKAIALTPEFAACVAAKYVPCVGPLGGTDSRPDSSSLVGAARSANATKVGCRTNPPPGAGAFTEADDEHDYDYGDVEGIKIVTPLYSSMAAQWNAGTTTAGYVAAGLIWHEAMHVHGYGHGANSNPPADAMCGYAGKRAPDGTPASWRVTAGPYVVGNCVTTVGSSFVPNAVKAAHKRFLPALGASLDGKLATGAVTAEQVRALARQNGVAAQATPLSFNGSVVDELFDSLDQDWYVVRVPGKMPVRVIVETTDGTLAPQVTVTSSLASGDHFGPSASEILGDYVDMTRTLDGGLWYVHVYGATRTPSALKVSIREAPAQAPDSCSGTVFCGSRVDFACAAGPRVRFVEHSADGVTWFGSDGLSAPTYKAADGTFGPGRYYRVCEKTVTTTAKACTDAIDINTLPGKCDGVSPGGGPSPGAGGPRCRGRLCTTFASDGAP